MKNKLGANDMKRSFLIFCLGIPLLISACTAKDSGNRSITDETVSEVKAEDLTDYSEIDGETDESSGEELFEDSVVISDEIKNAYDDALITLRTDLTLPNGEKVVCDESSNNQYSITDVDNDGVPELVILIDGAFMTAKVGQIYQYDAETGSMHLEFQGFSAFECYDNGIIKEDWSHNQGYGEMWPYFLHKYNPNKDEYELIASIDSWNRDMSKRNFNGDSFPADVDDGAGVVYYVTFTGDEDSKKPISQSEYDAFYKSYMDWADLLYEQYEEFDVIASGN